MTDFSLLVNLGMAMFLPEIRQQICGALSVEHKSSGIYRNTIRGGIFSRGGVTVVDVQFGYYGVSLGRISRHIKNYR
jgi:hypothetical protein